MHKIKDLTKTMTISLLLGSISGCTFKQEFLPPILLKNQTPPLLSAVTDNNFDENIVKSEVMPSVLG